MKMKRSKWAKRCSECRKVLASHNKSLLCHYHFMQKWDENNKDKRKGYYQKNKVKILKYYKKRYKEKKKLENEEKK